MWVGLSATLSDAERFFGRLIGLSPDFVREVAPLSEDLEERGHEYQLLLRGDPTSQTALLSTSIQSLMLLLRLLDPLGTDVSHGAFGSKVFAFCDNLDLINRLYRQLLDAEGRDPVGKPDLKRQGSLARLRSEVHYPRSALIEDWPDRDRNGQQWWIVDRLRESPVPAMIGRTSSQDTGVTAEAEIIVATASLEVGFDDPTVGAVFQHKAPRDLAQFVQRRGRAGRSQSMRPWTVVVLSDYGRDRITYQSYERLFDPTLPPKSLPLANRSVQRMQATFAVMDWAGEQLRRARVSRGSVRDDLSRPQIGQGRSRQEAVAKLLAEVLEDKNRRTELSTYLQRSLRLSSVDVDILLWEGPRSLLFEALPTAVRRLESNWHVVRDGTAVAGGDRQRSDHPLPEFLPANLFSDLCLPEIEIVPPEDYDRAAETEEPVFLVLGQLAPGNVTLRYAVWKTKGLWIDPRTDGGKLDISGTFLQNGETIAQVTNSHGHVVDVVRPFAVRPVVPDRDVQTTSRGRFVWQARMTPSHEAIEADIPVASPWSEIVSRACFYLQAARGGIHLLRYTFGGVADIGHRRSGPSRVRYELARGHDAVAIGVELDVDALLVRIRPPSCVGDFSLERDSRRLRQLRRDYFLWLVEEELGDADGLNPFLATWLGELTLAAAAFEFTMTGRLASPSSWARQEWRDRLLEAFDSAFQDLHGAESGGMPSIALRDAIAGAMEIELVCELLAPLYECSMRPLDEAWYPWLRSRFAMTAAAAIHAAIQSLLTDFDADSDIAIDLVDHDECVDIWISDTSVGGGGLVEAVYAAYAEDPRRFWTLALGALEPQETEQAAEDLPRVVLSLANGDLGERAEAYRRAAGGELALRSWQDLIRAISQLGIQPSHALTVALATRVMRPGSSNDSDRALNGALDVWDAIERDIGFALNQRTAAALLSGNAAVIADLRRAAPSGIDHFTDAWEFNVLLGLLWAPAEEIRAYAFQPPMPFSERPPLSERTLLLDSLAETVSAVDVTGASWRLSVDSSIAKTGRCVVCAPTGRETHLRDALVQLMIDPIEAGSLHLHPRVVGLRRGASMVETTLELMEAPQ